MVKNTFLICAATFFLVICFLIASSSKLTPQNPGDPSSLAPPSREFEEWRKQWESSRSK